MSDKDRQKKDEQRKDKKNQRMREDLSGRAQQDPTPRQIAKHKAKLTDSEPRGEAKRRQKT